MADLISLSRAKDGINKASFTSAEEARLTRLITAASKAIKRYCRREFDSQNFDELYDGSGGRLLLLDQYPILSVSRVAGRPTTVLTVTNTATANQRASVAVTSTGLTLTRVASGVTSSNTITWTSNTTLTAVHNAINALGNGWSATLGSESFGNYASADLRAPQGALNALNVQAPLKIHLEELNDFSIAPDGGWLERSGGWECGLGNWRIVYTAGYATVPEDVQEACVQWVAALWWQTLDNPAGYPDLPTPGVVTILDHYRRHSL